MTAESINTVLICYCKCIIQTIRFIFNVKLQKMKSYYISIWSKYPPNTMKSLEVVSITKIWWNNETWILIIYIVDTVDSGTRLCSSRLGNFWGKNEKLRNNVYENVPLRSFSIYDIIFFYIYLLYILLITCMPNLNYAMLFIPTIKFNRLKAVIF